MTSQFKFIAIFLMIIALCGIVSADETQGFTPVINNVPITTQQAIYPNFAQTALPSAAELNLTFTNGNLLYLPSISSLDVSAVALNFAPAAPNGNSYIISSVPVSYGGSLLGTCTITWNYMSGFSGTYANYEVTVNNFAWNTNASTVTLPATGSLTLSYPMPAGWQAPSQIYVVRGTSNPTSSIGMLFPSALSSGGSQVCLVNSFGGYSPVFTQVTVYSFENIFSATMSSLTGAIAWNLTKVVPSPYSGTSLSYIYDGGGVLLPSVTDKLNHIGNSYNPPIYINITDPTTGILWQNAFFYPTFNISAPITTSTINTPLYIMLQVSNGIVPTDVNALAFQTNNYNSNNVYSNLLYDNNQTQRNPLNFFKKSGVWYQDDGSGFNINVGTTLPLSYSTKFLQANNYTISAILSSTVKGGFAASNNLQFYITGTASNAFAYFTISDSKTGNPISQSTLGIFDVTNQKWSNYTLQSGSINLPLTANWYYSYQGSAINYVPGSGTLLIPGGAGNATVAINLIPSSLAVSVGNTTFSALVEDSSSYAPISGATVTISAANSSNFTAQSQITTAGNALFIVPIGNTYTASATAPNYQSGSVIAVIGSSPVTVIIYLTHISSIPTIITSATTYPGQTPAIYPTVGGQITNQTNPFFGNAIDWLTLMGAKPTEIGLVLAFLLVILGTVCGSAASSVGLGYAYQPSPIGAMAGALLGFIASVAFGFFPAWLAVAAIVIIAFILAKSAWG